MSTSDVVTNVVPNKEDVANNNVVVNCQKTGNYNIVDNTENKKSERVKAIEIEYTNRFNKKRPSFGILPDVASLPTTTTTTTTQAPDCTNSTSSVKMIGWYAGDRILSPIGYAPYGRETYVYGDEVVRYETGVWLYENIGAEIVRVYSDAEWPWLADWPSPYSSEKVCDPTPTTTTTTTTTTLPPSPFIYGLDINGDIWEINVENKNFNLLYKNALSSGDNKQLFANGISYDTERDHLYYFIGPIPQIDSKTNITYNWYNLYYLSQNSNTPSSVVKTRLIESLPQGAAYFNNKIWFFKSQNSNILQSISLDYSRPYVMPTFPDFLKEYIIEDIDASQNNIGDMAVDVNTGMMYVINTNGRFYSINLNSPKNSFNLIRAANSDTPPSPQLAFNTNYSSLYCHGYANGDWYTVDKNSGSFTSLNFKSLFNNLSANKGLIDIAGSRNYSRIINTTNTSWDIIVQTTGQNQDFGIGITGTSVNIIVDWGDGTVARYTSSGNKTYTYSQSGIYTIKIKGSFNNGGNIKLGTSDTNRSRLKSVGVIQGISGLANFKQTFLKCTSLTSIPENLFINYPSLSTNVFDSTFSGCSGLTSIPENLFRNQTSVGKGEFYATFNNCNSLTSIPENLFKYNTSAGSASFNYTFSGCTSLTSVPANIFRYNTGVDSLSFFRVFDKVALSTTSYNNLLVSLNTYLGSKTGMQFNAGNSTHSGGGTTARTSLVSNGWKILDGSDLILHLDSQNSSSWIGSGTTWHDLSGFKHDAKLYNGAYYDSGFIVFDGSNDYAEVLNTSYLNNCLGSDFAFDIWVYVYATQIRAFGKIISKGGYFAPGFNGVSLSTSNSVVSASWEYRTSTVSTLLETSLTSNGWNNLVYTRSSGVLSLYKNGQFVSSTNNTYDLRSNYNLRIGSNYQPDNQSKQKIAVLKQYNRSLTPQEISASYAEYSSRFV